MQISRWFDLAPEINIHECNDDKNMHSMLVWISQLESLAFYDIKHSIIHYVKLQW